MPLGFEELVNYTCETNNYTAVSYSFMHHEVGVPGHRLLPSIFMLLFVRLLEGSYKRIGRRMVVPDPSGCGLVCSTKFVPPLVTNT
jgi:hypothetical protein